MKIFTVVLLTLMTSSIYAAENNSKVLCESNINVTALVKRLNDQIALAESQGYLFATAPSVSIIQGLGFACVTVSKSR